ncbi:hypothetical protein V5080_20920, partial [Atlantibacter hermannii]|uniref:hypothetical protein n=1 Tax=Atlantibacter hermannii TaxID=565 RepID=UPI00307627B7
SDKLLKSSAASLFLSGAGCVYYDFPLQSQAIIFAFLREAPGGASLTGRPVRRCSVSVVAHYRE